jgi:hypothetical protein
MIGPCARISTFNANTSYKDAHSGYARHIRKLQLKKDEYGSPNARDTQWVWELTHFPLLESRYRLFAWLDLPRSRNSRTDTKADDCCKVTFESPDILFGSGSCASSRPYVQYQVYVYACKLRNFPRQLYIYALLW